MDLPRLFLLAFPDGSVLANGNRENRPEAPVSSRALLIKSSHPCQHPCRDISGCREGNFLPFPFFLTGGMPEICVPSPAASTRKAPVSAL